MTNVKYVGSSDTRGVSKADFKSLGVEGDEVKAVEFKNGETKSDLPEEVAQILLEADTFIGEFKELSDDEVQAEEEKAIRKSAKQQKAEDEHVQGEGDTGSGDPSTGARGATGGSTGTNRGPAKKAASTAGNGSST